MTNLFLYSTISRRREDIHSIIAYNLMNAPRNLDMPIGTWATDGSHVAELAPSGRPSTTSALVGRTTTTYSIMGQATTSAHGELLALIVALHVVARERTINPTILSDYMNGINAVTKARDPHFRVAQWAGRPLSELYTWLGMMVKRETRVKATVQHVKAHTLAADRDSRLNEAADTAAKSAHCPKVKDCFRTLPPLTAYMKPYVVHDHSLGYVPDNWTAILDKRLAKLQFAQLPPKVKARLTVSPLRPNTAVRRYFYTRSPSRFVVKVQYLLRAGHIANDYINWKKGKKSTPQCSLCDYKMGTLDHLFRDCNAPRQIREKAVTEAVKGYRPFRIDGNSEVDGADLARLKQQYERYLVRLVSDADSPQFWFGLTGVPPRPLVPGDAGQAHDFAIKLTAHLYGKWINVQRPNVKSLRPRMDSSSGASLEEPEEGSEDEGNEDTDEYLTDLADIDIDGDQNFDNYYQDMHSVPDDSDDYASDPEQPQTIRDPSAGHQENTGWIPHGGRKRTSTQDDEGLKDTQGSGNRIARDTQVLEGNSQVRQGKRKRVDGQSLDGRRTKTGRLDLALDHADSDTDC